MQPDAHPVWLTIALGLGQTPGPIATGAIGALSISAVVLFAGAIVCMAYATLRDKRGLQGQAVALQSTPACGNI